MGRFIYYNPNPNGARVGDCTIRAMSKALDQEWDVTYAGVALQGLLLCDMPSSNAVWGAYLRQKGFKRYIIPNTCPDCYTVERFCEDHPEGTFVLAISGHVVCVEDGRYFDTWDSGNQVPLYYWQKE